VKIRKATFQLKWVSRLGSRLSRLILEKTENRTEILMVVCWPKNGIFMTQVYMNDHHMYTKK